MKNNLTTEDKLTLILKEIDEYKPATKWEAANNRTLKHLHKKRKSLEQAIENKNNKNKENR